MTAPTIADYLKYANLQMAAEALYGFNAYANRPNLIPGARLPLTQDNVPLTLENLTTGNLHASKMTADEVAMSGLTSNWEVVSHISNTTTGFSGTLFRNKDTNELVMSFRSTEFIDDAARDNQATNVLEIKENGWALGQLSDMEAWYKSLQDTNQIPAGAPLTLTGYSLGSHMATAFNLMHPGVAQAVYNFNGAGVGLIGDGTLDTTQRQLPEMVAKFQARRDQANTDAGLEDLMSSALGKQTYQELRDRLKQTNGVPDDSLLALLDLRMRNEALTDTYPDPYIKADYDSLKNALVRAISVKNYAHDVPGFPSGSTDGGPANPATISDTYIDPTTGQTKLAIAAESLDYQLAYLSTIKQYDAHPLSLLGGLAGALDSPTPAKGGALGNQFDLAGTEDADHPLFMVAHSQYRYGTEFRLFVEDQPQFRGSVLLDSVTNSFKAGEVRLLVPNYTQNDFGDTHSLVLILDSLNVQNTLLNFVPQDQKESTAKSLNSLLFRASNHVAESTSGTQGKSEGDVLENVVNALGDMLIGKGNFQHLNGSLDGNTWAKDKDFGDYTGRETFYARLKQIQKTVVDGGLAGQVEVVAPPMDGLSARTDFGALLSLVTMAPFALKGQGPALESALKVANPDLYAKWEADKGPGDERGERNFSDQYLKSRAAFNERVFYYNKLNARYDTSVGISPADQKATDHDAEDIIWSDRASKITIKRGSGITESTRYVTFGGDDDEGNIVGGKREDRLYGGGGNDTVVGAGGDDHLEGNAGDDVLDGGTGVDTLVGGVGNDTLIGGEGHDLLFGGKGDDTYQFSGNFGLDIIRDSDGKIVVGAADSQPLAGGKKLAENVYLSDDKSITYTQVGSELVIRASGGGASGFIMVQGWQPDQLGIGLDETPANPVTTATPLMGDFKKMMNEAQTSYVLGSDGNYQSDGAQLDAPDLITGTSGADSIQGLGGNDALFGAAGDDRIEGGSGHDVLMGGLGADSLLGGSGNDLIYGSSTGGLQYPLSPGWVLNDNGLAVLAEGWNWRTYTDGSQDIWGVQNRQLSLSVARDEQFADAGNVIEGGAGDDDIFAGTGGDVVHGGDDKDYVVGMGGDDVLFGDGGDDVMLGDGTVQTGQISPVTWTPAEAHGNDLLVGGDGKDVLIGQGGSDVLYGGIGNDVLFGDDYDDARTPVAIHADDYLNGGEGDDVLYGNGGGDVLLGGTGNDTLVGGLGRDVYVFNKGDGTDWVYDSKAEGNVFRFGAGVTAADIKLSLGSLLLDLGGGDAVHIEGFNPQDALNSSSIDSFEFQDGSTLSVAQLLERGFDIDGTEGNDVLSGTNVNDRIRGFGGNDRLITSAGDDVLQGGDGDDTYVVRSGAGHVTISDTSGFNAIEFEAGIPLVAVQVSTVDGKMVLAVGTTTSITIDGAVAQYRFAEGIVLSEAQLRARGQPGGLAAARIDGTDAADQLQGTAGTDYIFGGAGDDTAQGADGNDFLFGETGNDVMRGDSGADALSGGVGNDTLEGEAGADRLWGQAGDDVLRGGDGDDELSGGDGVDQLIGGRGNDLLMAGGIGAKTYLFDLGDGEDLVMATGQARHIRFGAGIAQADVKIFASPTDAAKPYVKVQYSATDSMIIELGTGTGSLDYQFGNGTVISHASLAAAATQATRAPYVILGTEGVDSLTARGRATWVVGGPGADQLYGRNSYAGGSFNYVLQGGSGNDSLSAEGGNDLLVGGAGDDQLNGYTGSDTYLYRRGDGSDTIVECADSPLVTNTLRFTDLSAADVIYTREANGSLKIHIVGSADVIDMPNWFGKYPVRLQRIEYADGSTQDMAALGALAQAPLVADTVGAQLTGTRYQDIIVGSIGADTIDGGVGDDTLNGGAGADTYLLRWGMGRDTITETSDDINVLQLGNELGFEQLVFQRQSDDLLITLLGSEDGVLLKGYYAGPGLWSVTNTGGQAEALSVVLDQFDRRTAPVSVEQLRNQWLAGAEAQYTNYYIGANSGASPDDTVGFADVARSIDAVSTERESRWETDSYVTQDKIVTIEVPVERFDVVDQGQGHLVITDWRNLGTQGQPSLTDVDLNAGVSIDWVGNYTIHRGPVTTGVRTLDVTVRQVSHSDRVVNVEQITGGASDNVVLLEGLGTVDGGAGDDVLWGRSNIGSDKDAGGFFYGGAGDDFIMGGFGRDMVVGGEGDDYLAGSAGDDTYYLVASESGIKIIDEAAETWSGSNFYYGDQGSFSNTGLWDFWNPNDTVEFGPGITLDTLLMRRGQYTSPYAYQYWAQDPAHQQFATLDFTWGEGKQARVLLRPPYNGAADDDGTGIEYFKFADGTVLSMAQMQEFIDARNQHTLQLWAGDGPVSLALSPQINAISFGPGILAANVAVSKEGADLVLNAVGTNDEWRLQGWYDDPAKLTSFSANFVDGTTWNATVLAGGGAVNHPPVLAQALADQVAAEDAAWSFAVPTGTFADPDAADTLTYGASLSDGGALPAWLSFHAASRTFSGTPGNADVGGLTLRVTATDSAGESESDEFTLNVTNVNDAPLRQQALANQQAIEDAAWSFVVPLDTFADPDAGDTLTYCATLDSGDDLPGWLHFDAATRTFVGTPLNADVGSLALAVTATDAAGAAVSESFTLTIANVNDAPSVVEPIAEQVAAEDMPWMFTVPAGIFVDVDAGDSVTYSARLAGGDALPAWLRFDESSRTFAGTPSNAEVGSLSLQVTATDAAGESASQSFTLTIANANDAPTLVNAIGAKVGTEDVAWTFTVPANTFTDIDVGDMLGYSATLADGSALPAWLTFDPNTCSFSGTPLNADVGSLKLKVSAADGAGAAASAAFTLTVANVNDAPVVAGSLPDWTASAGNAMSYIIPSAAFYDVDTGDTLAYSASLSSGAALPAWLTFNAPTCTLSGTPTANDGGSFTLKITATDSGGLAAAQTLALYVDPSITAYGTNGADVLNGGVGSDYIDGLAGADTMAGHQGDDTYIVDNLGDVVLEISDEGFDTVNSNISYTLPSNVEALTLTGSANINAIGNTSNNLLVGNAGANRLTGGAGNDVLDGGAGNDTMIGGTGDDTYYVDNVNDVVSEASGEGFDVVYTSVSYTLSNNVESLVLAGSSAIDATGSAGNNLLAGNSAANQLRGGAGNDKLYGEDGADLLYGDAGDDVIDGGLGNDMLYGAADDDTLLGGAGADLLYGSAGLDLLYGNVGDDQLYGEDGSDFLSGDDGNDYLSGGTGNDTLDGGAGSDSMLGGVGDDQYLVDNEADTITEYSGEGTDSVLSSVSYTLGANLEKLTLSAIDAINGTGNSLDNVIVGNAAPCSLRGMSGKDTLSGGIASDTLEGGTGADSLNGGLGGDTYLFARGDGQDTLVDVDATAGVQDVLQFGSSIAADQIWLRKNGSDLEVSVIGTTDKVTLSGWYLGADHHVEILQLSNGQRLLDTQVQDLVQAMAAFAPPSAGQSTLSASYHSSLDGVIAANWQ